MNVFCLFNLVVLLHLCLSFITICMLTALQNLLIACLPPSCSQATPGFPFWLTPILSKLFMQESNSISILSSLLLVSREATFLCLYFILLMTCNSSRERYQDTSSWGGDDQAPSVRPSLACSPRFDPRLH